MNQGVYQLLFILIYFVPLILFFITLQNTLKIISPENRRMQPAAVWLSLLPLFGFIWQLVVVTRMSDSIKAECQALDIPLKEERPTYTIDVVYCFSFLLFLIPAVKTVGSILVLVTWLIYWSQVYKFKKLLSKSRT